MDTPRPQTLMTTLGFDPEASWTYSRLLPLDGWQLTSVALALGITPDALVAQAAPLVAAGVVRLGETVTVLAPADVFAHMLEEAAAGALAAGDSLLRISQSVPFVAGTTARVTLADHVAEQPIDGEVVAAVEWGREMFGRLVDTTSGNLSWLRPLRTLDHSEVLGTPILERAVAGGRRCRGVYPLTVLKESPETVRARVEAGEEVRVLPFVPSHLLVVGSTHAMFPDPMGTAEHPTVIVRQRGVVELAARYFEELWGRAVPVSEFDDFPGGERILLLQELAGGAQDEQIARRLGVSLRTVRRRVAELLAELDASSRFEAGVEAVRRGWL